MAIYSNKYGLWPTPTGDVRGWAGPPGGTPRGLDPPGVPACLDPRGVSAFMLTKSTLIVLKVKTVTDRVGARDFFVKLDELYNFAIKSFSLSN